MLAFAASYIARWYQNQGSSVRQFQAFYLLPLYQYRLALPSEAAVNARTALRIARTIQHQPGTLRSLALVFALDSQTSPNEEVDQLLATSYYNVERALALCSRGMQGCDSTVTSSDTELAAATLGEIETLEAQMCWRSIVDSIPEVLRSVGPKSAFNTAQSLEALFDMLMTFNLA